LTAWADADRTRQMLDNLISNALRATPEHSTIEIGLALAGLRNEFAEISVRDEGPGFPPDFLPHAFERFRRADLARARAGPALPGGSVDGSGTGLGLAVVRSLSEAHGGSAQARNRPEGGAVVSIRLPRQPPGEAV
jgi:two-component system OmpR family sensor kinase